MARVHRRVCPVRKALAAQLSGGPRRRVGAAAAIAVALAAIGVVVATGLPGSSEGATPPPKGTNAATVERRNLVATDTESGTLGYSGAQTVYNRVSGTITWLPTVGQVIKPGQTLYKVDNAPVVLFDGTTPAYRDLSAADTSGPDILELNRDLVRLGFDPNHEITAGDTWQTGTTDAIYRWQAALGETQTGTITLGQVVFLPGSQLIKSVETVLGSNGASSSGSGSGGSGSGSGTPASTPVAGRAQFVDLTSTTPTSTTPTSTTPTSTTPTTTTPAPSGSSKHGSGNGTSGGSSSAQLKALIALLRAEIAELKNSHSSSGAGSGAGGKSGAGASSNGSRGGGGSPGGGSGSGGSGSGGSGASGSGSSGGGGTAQAVLQTTSTQEVVTVQLDATKQSEAVVGEQVSVQLPDGSTVPGRITAVSRVAQSSSGSSGSGSGAGAGNGGSSNSATATIPVTIALLGHTRLSGLDQAAVSVVFAQQRANNVLSVPVTALIATQGGGYAVQEAQAPHALIPVTPGLFAAGYVEISGSGINAGVQVTDSQG
jgi:hypothetical protein